MSSAHSPIPANDDHPVSDAANTVNGATAAETQESFIDLNEQRIRVVGDENRQQRQILEFADTYSVSYQVQATQRRRSNSRKKVIRWEMH